MVDNDSKKARAFFIWTWITLILLTLLLLLDPNSHGSRGVSTLMMRNGKTLIIQHEKRWYMASGQVTYGWIKLSTIKMEKELEAMYALRFTCHHGEHVSSNMSISVPVQSPTCQKVLLRVCEVCATSIAKQALEVLENISPAKRIAKSDLDALD